MQKCNCVLREEMCVCCCCCGLRFTLSPGAVWESSIEAICTQKWFCDFVSCCTGRISLTSAPHPCVQAKRQILSLIHPDTSWRKPSVQARTTYSHSHPLQYIGRFARSPSASQCTHHRGWRGHSQHARGLGSSSSPCTTHSVQLSYASHENKAM